MSVSAAPEVCPDCGLPAWTDDPGQVRGCNSGFDHPVCPDCKEPIIGARWNGGRCLDCHMSALGPDPCDPGCDEYCPHT